MKVGIVLVENGLPVPSVKGGAIEQLLTMILEQNEIHGDAELEFFIPLESKKDIKKYNLISEYRHSKINYIVTNKFTNFIIKCFNKVAKTLFHKHWFLKDYYRKVYKKLKKNEPDKIVFEGQYPFWCNKFFKKFGRDKLCFHIHCQHVDEEYGMPDDIVNQMLNSPCSIDHFGTIISVSDFISNDWRHLYKKHNLKPSNIVTVLNSVDEEKFQKPFTEKEKQELRENLGIKKDDFVLLFCGRIVKEKGIKLLTEAVSALNQDNIKLMVLGSVNFDTSTTTPYAEEVKKIALENSDKIKFTGYVKNDEVYKYYKSADLFVLPSVWNDACPLTIIEARVTSTPILATISGGITENVPAEVGILLKPDESLVGELQEHILKLSSDKKLYKKLKDGAEKNADKYKKENFYKNFIKTLEEK